MNITVSKWGNSSGIRIPTVVINTLGIVNGDELSCELVGDRFVVTKKKTTEQMFEEFYGKPFNEITTNDIGPGEELDWGEDIGGEIIE